MIDRLALVGHAAGAVGHQPLPLGRADRGAQVGLAGQAAFALTAFRGVKRDDMVIGLDAGDTGTDFANNSRAFVPKHAGELALAVQAVERVGVGVTDAGRHDLDQHLARLGPFQIQFNNLERLLGFKCYGSAGFHIADVLFLIG